MQTHYKVRRTFVRLGIIITAGLLALIALFSFFAEYSGTFTITVAESDLDILSLSETDDFINPITYLCADEKANVWPTEYKNIDIEAVCSTNGNYLIARDYFGYTFYLKNMGNDIANVECIIRLNRSLQQLYKCARFLLIQDNSIIGVFKYYDEYIDENDSTPIELYKFAESTDIMYRFTLPYVQSNQIIKFSVIIWLDGWDIDCTDERKGGFVSYSMQFTVISTYKKEN